MAEAENTESAETTPQTEGAESGANSSDTQQATEMGPPDWSKLDAIGSERAESQATPETDADSADKDGETEAPFPLKADENTSGDDTEPDTKQASPEAEPDAEGEEDDDELDTLNETLTDEEKNEVNLPKPARRKLRQLEKIDKAILEPLRNHDTPIEEFADALIAYQPERAREFVQAAVTASIDAQKDQWLSYILGSETNVDSVKNALANKGATPQAESAKPLSIPEIPSLRDQPEVKALIDSLTDVYSDDWLDPSKDDELLEDDRLAAQSLRAQLASEESRVKKEQELSAALQEAQAKIESLTPEVDKIKESQQTQAEREVLNLYKEVSEKYRDDVMERAIPRVSETFGLKVADSDTEQVKALKTVLNGKFESSEEYASDFEYFAETQYSGRDNLQKVMNRVQRNLADAVKKEYAAKTADASSSQALLSEAENLRARARDDQDVLSVMVSKAAKEFLAKEYQPILDVVKENADLKRQIAKGVRTETIGQGAAASGGRSIMDIAKGDDPLGEALKALG